MCALLTYWPGLYGSEMQGKILEGVKILISCVYKVMPQQRRSPPLLLAETAPSQDGDEDLTEDEA